MQHIANHSRSINLTTAPQKQMSGLLSLAAFLLCGISAYASNPKVAAEQGFTIAPNANTAIVLKALPDAACDLHATGSPDTRYLRFYANGEGYVKLNANAREGIEGRVQLDCTARGKAVSYPLHLIASSMPTADMPVPQSKIPMPKGSRVRPALTEAQVQSMSDEQLDQAGYPARPDVLSDPERYAKWLERLSKPVTVLPTHLVARSDIRSAPKAYNSSNWSGLEAHSTTKHNYSAVDGTWVVPPIVLASSDGNPNYSSFWIGLDGDGIKDLVQAGTEQDAQEILGLVFSNYYAWSELLPNQPTEQTVFSVDAGDEMTVEVWIGTGSGSPNPNGDRGSFRVTDVTQGIESRFDTLLGKTTYNGTEAEWIMERPTVGGSLPELAAYLFATMGNGNVLKVSTNKWVHLGTAANRNISMYNGKDLLSEDVWEGKGTQDALFIWANFE